jgi:hypothetical protein
MTEIAQTVKRGGGCYMMAHFCDAAPLCRNLRETALFLRHSVYVSVIRI